MKRPYDDIASSTRRSICFSWLIVLAFCFSCSASAVFAQEEVLSDDQVRQQITEILHASRRYEELSVVFASGVVFIEGRTDREEYVEWASDVISQLDGVIGVVNRLEVHSELDWSLAPAWKSIESIVNDVTARLPLILFGLFILVLVIFIATLARRLILRVARKRTESRLLADLIANVAVVPLFLTGVYVFLHVAGLTRLAATVLGSTGVLGLVLGIAFRDMVENFLASVLISAKRPFRIGDLIEVQDKRGYVESITTRGTLLVTPEGNHIHIPNSDIYKNAIFNFTANPSTRYNFAIGIDYGDSAAEAQEICLGVLEKHPAVLEAPEPLVLVEELGSSSVVLRIYFWVNIGKYEGTKVRSAIIRQVKSAIESAELTMPDDAREIIFPRGIPVNVQDEESGGISSVAPRVSAPTERDVSDNTEAEGDLGTESKELKSHVSGTEALDMGELLVDEKSEADSKAAK